MEIPSKGSSCTVIVVITGNFPRQYWQHLLLARPLSYLCEKRW